MHRLLKPALVVCGLLIAFCLSAGRAQEGEPKPAKVKDAEVKPALVTLRERVEEQNAGVKNAPRRLDTVTRVGEKLTYIVKWKGFPAGRATLRVKRKAKVRGREAFAFEMRAESNDFLDVFYEVDSTVTSIADIETGTSYLFKRSLHEGRRRVDDRLEFDLTHKGADGVVAPVAKYSKVKRGRAVHNAPRPIPGPLQDSLSVVYYLRHLKFENPGDEYKLLIGSRKRVDTATITAERFTELNLGKLGRFGCVVVEPQGDKDAERTTLIAAKGSARIWLERNTGIPLLIVVDVPIGSVTISLIEALNTDLDKYTLDAKKQAAEPKKAEGAVTPPGPEDF